MLTIAAIMDFISQFAMDVSQSSFWEWLAVITGVGYVVLAARTSIWCWFFALASSCIYIYLCYVQELFIETWLQLFYAIMAVVGYFSWKKGSNGPKLSKGNEVEVKEWPFKYHFVNIMASFTVVAILGYAMSRFTAQANPYTDAFTTVFSLTATFMVTRKILSNWWYWVIIDLVSIYLYYSRGYALSSILYLLFTILAIFGWYEWKKRFSNADQ